MLLFTLLSVGCLSKHDVPAPDSPDAGARVMFRLHPSPVATQSAVMSGKLTKSSPESQVGDASLYFFSETIPGDLRHVYTDSGNNIQLSLPKGRYELFTLANIGEDPGDMTRDQVEKYICTLGSGDDPIDGGLIPMSARQTVTIEGDAEIPILLRRTVARVDLTVTVDPSCPENLTVHTVSLRNVTASIAMFGDNRPPADEMISPYSTVGVTDNRIQRTYYIPENLRGENSKPATITLMPVCTNDPEAPLWFSYALNKGTGFITLDGMPISANEKRRVYSDTELACRYIQDDAGEVEILFTLTDAYGNCVTNDASTTYRDANPVSVLTMTSKVGMVATVAFTINESGYSGRFTVSYRSVSGSGEVTIDGSKIVSGGSKTTAANTAPLGVKCPVNITPSGDFSGDFTVSDMKGNSRSFRIYVSKTLSTIDVTEI
ncbi:MAG: DUF4906 domain-containing protein [Alistipes indistinctus]|nr:DUF4906 domain-containing protein [Alistipes indistinctus]